MKRFTRFIKNNPRFTASFVIVFLAILLMLKFGVDKKVIAIVTIVFGYVTNLFVGVLGAISLIPIIGPIVVKVLTIPFFWLLNSLGYVTSAVVIKKGYVREYSIHRLITLSLLTGIVIGYVLGHLIPMR